uniref:Cycloamanide D n=1 Tax=Amanita phalloides TaxID=67723 RepID=CYAD_AMAPH|nr:RecName: Full=Cycloamanide D; Short=CyA D; Short=Cyl D [Amanita phalloides]
MLGFLPLP